MDGCNQRRWSRKGFCQVVLRQCDAIEYAMMWSGGERGEESVNINIYDCEI